MEGLLTHIVSLLLSWKHVNICWELLTMYWASHTLSIETLSIPRYTFNMP
jgi:hypothetical protein